MDIKTYVSDSLLRLTGASDPTVIDFILATASSAKSSGALREKLEPFLDPEAGDIDPFVSELWSRAGKPGSGGNLEKQKKPEATAKKRYRLVEMEDDVSDQPGLAPMDAEKTKRRERNGDSRSRGDKEEKRKRGRDAEGSGRHRSRKLRRIEERDFEDRWGDEQVPEDEIERHDRAEDLVEGSLGQRDGSPSVASVSSDADEGTKREKARQRDLKERDEFAKRLAKKDEERSKKIVEDRSSTKNSDVARRRALAEDAAAREAAMPDLRLRSRQEYLKKREAERLALLRKQVAEETAELRENPTLTRREKEEFAKNRELLRLAEERSRIDDHRDGYMLPEDYITEKGKIDRKRKEEALYKRYVDRDERGQERFVTEHEEWEIEQTSKAKAQISRAEFVDEGDYEYVFDDAQKINFIMDSKLEGDRKPLSKEQRLLAQQIDAAEKKAASIEETRKSLPIYQFREELLQAIADHQIIIIVGETGSGKTTQIPQYLHEAGYTKGGMKIGCTQPRRVAAMSVAARVAEEMGVKVGNEVGYAIRFEDATSDKTILKYMTDGLLLKELLTEPDLSQYAALMIDEAHERTVPTDIACGLLKDIAKARPDLKLLISSATIDAQKFQKYFDDAPIFNIPGRRYPVDIHYTSQPEANYLAAAITTVFQIHITQGRGDILVFLTGQEEIEAAEQNLQETARKLGGKVPEMIICPIYANLPSELQTKIFEPTPPGARKVVLATNIAETSLTIDGIVYVIDPGFVKENVFNPRTGMESLVVTPCSRASAGQRAGRAGRVGPGKCFRLYTKWAYHNELEANTTPEIQRTNLSSVVLMLKSLGIDDLLDFDFMDPPPAETLIRALEQLYALGALNDHGELTKIGRQMAEFPTDPMLAKAILAAGKYGCVEEILSIIAMLGEASALFYRPKDKKIHADSARARFTVKDGGDHLSLLNIWNQWVDSDFSYVWARENFLQQRSLTRARDVRDQLAKLCDRVEVAVSTAGANNLVPIQKAITAGFFPNAARLQRGGDSYWTVKNGQTVYLHPSSTLFEVNPKWVIYHELVLTSKEYMRSNMPLQPEWLVEVAPHYHKQKDLETLANRKLEVCAAIGALSLDKNCLGSANKEPSNRMRRARSQGRRRKPRQDSREAVISTDLAVSFNQFQNRLRYPRNAPELHSQPHEMSKTFTPTEVAEHKTADKGLYIIVDSGVYDITNFVDEHPGGAKILKRVAGKDASKQFWKREIGERGSTSLDNVLSKTSDLMSTSHPYRAIRAKFTPDTITVYQAYSAEIALPAVRAGKFVAPFKRTRMTWIKPSFLWMAYRSGWASKPNQERILAIEISRAGFEWALLNSFVNTHDPAFYGDHRALEERKRNTCVRVQWDPERDFGFEPLPYRSIQVGLSGEAVERYVDEWIVAIEDVTELMVGMGRLVAEGKIEEARELMPVEKAYPLPEEVAKVVGAS
ncbi:ATP-dependent RNA helicase DHX8 [Uncinocarpus reesii 1704]|uniref:RNA helicase n=1 Tax=Uncinocarpus reesii (strain UAMH 1704) TaxID=336963 RepID=C4JEY7_UNCRE|nr:ATP-dependent RNA helicase DHX8 [Uncinocarpus reesii 1704]EEP76040.1 ATP-dependent RNA helicase DHX8 [Uncinocarpus reesii 1704]